MPMDWSVVAQGLANFSNLMQSLLAQQIQTKREEKLFEKRLGLQTEKQKEVAKFQSELLREAERERLAIEHQNQLNKLREQYHLETEAAMLQFFNYDRQFYEDMNNLPNLPPEKRDKVMRFWNLHEKLSAGEPLTNEELDFLRKNDDYLYFTGKLFTLNSNAINQQLQRQREQLGIVRTAQEIQQEKEAHPWRMKSLKVQTEYMEALKERALQEGSMSAINGYLNAAERLLNVNTQRTGTLRQSIISAFGQLPKLKKKDRETLTQEIAGYAKELQELQKINNQIYNDLISFLGMFSQKFYSVDLSSVPPLPNPLLSQPSSTQTVAPILPLQTPQARSVFQSLPKEEQENLAAIFKALKDLK
jgi:hypothetical protein